MNKIFDSIRQMDEAGQEYWSARELASVIGYADYRNFSKIIDKVSDILLLQARTHLRIPRRKISMKTAQKTKG